MKIFAFVVWAIVSYFLASRTVTVRIGKTQKNNILVKWLVLFFIPVIILVALSIAGFAIFTALSIAIIMMVLLPILLLIGYLTVGIGINGKKYKLRK